MDGSFPFGVSQFTTMHQSFEDDVELLSRMHIQYIDIVERKLSLDTSTARRQAQMVTEAGLKVSGFVPRVHALFPDTLTPDIRDPALRLQHYKSSIDFVAESWPGQTIPLTAITGRAPEFDYSLAYSVARRLYPELAEYAASAGLQVMLEPLSPVMMNTDTFICTLEKAFKFVREIDHPAFGLLFDTWHVWDEPWITATIQAAIQTVFEVQVSDWPPAQPRSFGDRLIPGDGVIELPKLISALEEAGYRGPYVLEIFSDDKLPNSLWLQSPEVVISRSQAALNNMWEAAGLTRT
jgi:sugar phosphate isomerase/epimerase